MGIEALDKVYILSHVHKFNEKHECLHNHESGKLIGIFYSKDKALDILESYKKLEGFRDQLSGFCIQEHLIDRIDDTKLNELLENKKTGKYSDLK